MFGTEEQKSTQLCGCDLDTNTKTVSKRSQWAGVMDVNSVHTVVIDVKMGIKPCFRAPSHLLSIVAPAAQPAQYLLRHLQSNLGWQAQMASLIQVNYLWTFQSKQTCLSVEVWILISKKKAITWDLYGCLCIT